MSDPAARQSWEEMLADLGFGQETKPVPSPSTPAPPVVEAVSDAKAAPDAKVSADDEAAPRKRKKRSRAESERDTAKKSRRKARTIETAEETSTVKISDGTVSSEMNPVNVTPLVVEPAVAEQPSGDLATQVEPFSVQTPAVTIEEKVTAEVESETEDNADKLAEEAERKKRRRRRRGRGRSKGEGQEIVARTPEGAASEDDEDESEEEIVGETGGELPLAADEEDEQFEDLSNLQVPTWQELVASLYRPADR